MGLAGPITPVWRSVPSTSARLDPPPRRAAGRRRSAVGSSSHPRHESHRVIEAMGAAMRTTSATTRTRTTSAGPARMTRTIRTPRTARNSTLPRRALARAVARPPAAPELDRRGRTLERLLAQHGARLLACKRSLRDELPAVAAAVRDEMDNSADHLARAVGVALLEACSATVREIDGAIQRLHKGTYGRCIDCGEKIAAVRLKVVPFAERCRGCQNACDGPVPTPIAQY